MNMRDLRYLTHRERRELHERNERRWRVGCIAGLAVCVAVILAAWAAGVL